MGYVVFAAWYQDKATPHMAIYNWFKERGHTVNYVWGNKTQEEWEPYFHQCDHAFIYNGSRKEALQIRQAAEKVKHERGGSCLSYYEGGILPARSHQFIDPCGVLGDSAFCVHHDSVNDYALCPETGRSLKKRAYNASAVDWVTKKHMKDLAEWKKWYIEQLKFTEQDIVNWRLKGDRKDSYIFVPMQCWWDANLNEHNGWSPWTGKNAMHKMIEWIQDEYPNDRIRFRCHPANLPMMEEYRALMRPGNTIDEGEWAAKFENTEPPLIKEMCNAKLVVGMNSTCLLQSVLMDIPTRALGWGYIQAAGPESSATKFKANAPGSGEASHEKQLKMVAAVRHRTFRWNDKEKVAVQMEEMHGTGKQCGPTFWAP
tara:strand:- start:19113 stop:20225 length:1113 start_codon:yes stop_codon:yes gene_type:complete